MDQLDDVGRYIREQRRQAELSLRKLASQAGVSNPYLSQIERGPRQPSARILKDIAKALRISPQSLYVPVGILRDPHLTERQKQVLIDVYRSFRAEQAADKEGAP